MRFSGEFFANQEVRCHEKLTVPELNDHLARKLVNILATPTAKFYLKIPEHEACNPRMFDGKKKKSF